MMTRPPCCCAPWNRRMSARPRDVRVVGFDDVKYATLVSFPLTTIHQPCRDIAVMAFRTMMERLAEPTLAGAKHLSHSPPGRPGILRRLSAKTKNQLKTAGGPPKPVAGRGHRQIKFCHHALTRIFHGDLGKSREKPYEKRGANTFEGVVETTRHAGLETGEAEARLANSRLGSLRYDVGMPLCQQSNGCALTALDGNYGIKTQGVALGCPVAAFQALYSHRHAEGRKPWI